jgi:hypothetical protein
MKQTHTVPTGIASPFGLPVTICHSASVPVNQCSITDTRLDNIAPLDDGVSGVTCYNVIDVASTGDLVLYNTLVTIDASNIGSGPAATRTVPVLFAVSFNGKNSDIGGTEPRLIAIGSINCIWVILDCQGQ